MTTTTRDSRLMGFLSLFTSFGTLICCALPSLLVLLGPGRYAYRMRRPAPNGPPTWCSPRRSPAGAG